ncbi:protein translocase subunit SecF [Candidatus Woesearchaeota archaeon]|nr:MAG: protein translocase subunit SecF [Candidatus Woesearchaeota archaeon]
MGKESVIKRVYRDHYRPLLFFSLFLVVLSLAVIGYKLATTGDFIDKGVSLKGGITLTVLTEQPVDPEELAAYLHEQLPKADVNVRTTAEAGKQKSVLIEASDTTSEELLAALQEKIPDSKNKNNIAIDSTDPVLGALSFIQTMKAVYIAFLFMAIVVFLYFGEHLWAKIIALALAVVSGIMMFHATSTVVAIVSLIIGAAVFFLCFKYSIPSIAVILAAFSDIMFAIACLNIIGMKLSIAGIAAFLMLIGYSVDTDILLSVRVMKRKEGSIFDRVLGAFKTGITMSLAALAAVIVTLIFVNSDVIRQIMMVLLFGLIADMIFTWFQNAGILRWHFERKGKT